MGGQKERESAARVGGLRGGLFLGVSYDCGVREVLIEEVNSDVDVLLHQAELEAVVEPPAQHILA